MQRIHQGMHKCKFSFEVKLSYESMPLPLPSFNAIAEGSELTSLHMLVNLPNYCRSQSPSTETDVIKELLDISYYKPKGRPLYSTKTLRFALLQILLIDTFDIFCLYLAILSCTSLVKISTRLKR